MAKTQLKYGRDPEMRKLAEDIINAQQPEIDQMQAWLKKNNKDCPIRMNGPGTRGLMIY